MMGSAVASSEVASLPVSDFARLGPWAMPVYALTLGVGSLEHQPPRRLTLLTGPAS